MLLHKTMITRITVKKNCEGCGFTQSQLRLKEEIETIQSLYAEGFSRKEIRDILHTTYNRIRKYLYGDPSVLCQSGRCGVKHSICDKYLDEITELFSAGSSIKTLYSSLVSCAPVNL